MGGEVEERGTEAPGMPGATTPGELTLDRMRDELNRLDREFASLRSQIDRKGDTAKTEYRQQMSEIESGISKLRDQVTRSTSENWATARQEMQKSLEEINKDLQELKDKAG
jgi:hypothetical protein